VGIFAGVGWIAQPGFGLRKPLIEIAQAGVLDAVEPDGARIALVWFLLFGFVLLILGSLVRWCEVRSLALPRSLAVHLALLSLLGVVLMPASGFWLCLPVAYRMFRYAALDWNEGLAKKRWSDCSNRSGFASDWPRSSGGRIARPNDRGVRPHDFSNSAATCSPIDRASSRRRRLRAESLISAVCRQCSMLE
jgi:hypothetical protein